MYGIWLNHPMQNALQCPIQIAHRIRSDCAIIAAMRNHSTYRTFLFFCALVFVAVSCAAPTPPPTPSPTAPPPLALPTQLPPAPLSDDIYAVYQRSGGVAGISETLTVHQDGVIELVTREGTKSLKVNDSILAPLRDLLAQPDFATLEPDYPAMGADLIVYTVIARDAAGSTRRVSTMDSAKPPEYLGRLIGMFEQLRSIVSRNG